jgi:hypothetical protein
MNDITNLNAARAARARVKSIPVDQADKMIAAQMKGCGNQLDLMAQYFTETGRPEIAKAVGKIGSGLTSLSVVELDAYEGYKP